MNNTDNSEDKGCSALVYGCFALTAFLAFLKAFYHLDCSWLLVFAPLLVPTLFFVAVFIIVCIIGIICGLFQGIFGKDEGEEP